jgi:NAD(P)-dependent dehydrogenase (short-subunit alcohol dehydrogenase family)
MGRLDSQVAMISGGARGQGAAEARLFTREGVKVVFGDILDGDDNPPWVAVPQREPPSCLQPQRTYH